MANQYITGTDAIARVRYRADIIEQTDRHTDSDLLKELNLSFRNVREKVSSYGSGLFLEGTTPASLTTSPPTSGEEFVEVDWPTNATAIYGVDIKRNNCWYQLQPADFSERRKFSGINNTNLNAGPCPPYAWCVRKIPQATTTTAAAGKLMLFPTPISGLQYRVWYLEVWADLTDPTHVFPGHSNWHDWMINDVAIKVMVRDNDAQGTLVALQQENAKLEASIRDQLRQIASDGPSVPMTRRRGYDRDLYLREW